MKSTIEYKILKNAIAEMEDVVITDLNTAKNMMKMVKNGLKALKDLRHVIEFGKIKLDYSGGKEVILESVLALNHCRDEFCKFSGIHISTDEKE